MRTKPVIDPVAPLAHRPAQRRDEQLASWRPRGHVDAAPVIVLDERPSIPRQQHTNDLANLTGKTAVTLDILSALLKELTNMDTMLDLDIEALDTHLAEIRGLLKDGLLSASIWARETGLSLVDYQPSHVSIALFNRLTDEIHSTLSGAGFPGLRRYYYIDLEDNQSVLILCHGNDLMEGLIMDSKRTNLGILLSVAVPKALKAVESARQ